LWLRPLAATISHSTISKAEQHFFYSLRLSIAFLSLHINMAPVLETLVRSATTMIMSSGAPEMVRRDLSVNSTQRVTLGVIAAFVVVIALLWNIPYVRGVLWPFKVSGLNLLNYADLNRCLSLHSMSLDMQSRLFSQEVTLSQYR
jgi:hypothetical protein